MRIAVLGGGTGTFTVLSGLKKHPVDLSAIVSIADSGGSSGALRDELGVLPPGDIRQCLVALAEEEDVGLLMRHVFNFRFSEGALDGHNLGNLILSGLEKFYGSATRGIEMAHKMLNVRGRVIPASVQGANLCAYLENGTALQGEHIIDEEVLSRAPIDYCTLEPSVAANAAAAEAIRDADLVVIGPGDLYTSLVPVLLVDGITRALAESGGRIVYVLNLVAKAWQTGGYTARTFYERLSQYARPAALDGVIVNTTPIPGEVGERYSSARMQLVTDDLDDAPCSVIRGDFLSRRIARPVRGDAVSRSLIRHDPEKLARAIIGAVGIPRVLD